MSLIQCPECSKPISDLSEKCIHCGFPAGQDKAQTIEMTSKDLKGQILLSVLLFIASILFYFKTGNEIALVVALAACGWYLITKLSIWWNHE